MAEPLRVRLHTALESLGLEGRWLSGRKAHFTRDEFLDIMADLIRIDTEVRARQLDVETMGARRREGAVLAVLAMDKAGLLSRKGQGLVREWKERSGDGELFPDLHVGVVNVVPPDGP